MTDYPTNVVIEGNAALKIIAETIARVETATPCPMSMMVAPGLSHRLVHIFDRDDDFVLTADDQFTDDFLDDAPEITTEEFTRDYFAALEVGTAINCPDSHQRLTTYRKASRDEAGALVEWRNVLGGDPDANPND